MNTFSCHSCRAAYYAGVLAFIIWSSIPRAEAQGCAVEDAGFTTSAPVQVLVDTQNTVVPELLISRDNGFRVNSLISAADAQRVVAAMGISVDVDPDGGGTTPVHVDITQLESRQYNTGPCQGRNTKSYKRTMVFLLLGRDSSGDFNIVFPGFWTDAPVAVSAFADPNAEINTQLRFEDEGDIRVLKFKGKTTSSDKISKVEVEFEYEGALPFLENSGDFKSSRFPFYFANQEAGETAILWCSVKRTRARLLSSDPNLRKVEIKVGSQGKLCLNGLEDHDGTVCVNLLSNDKGKPIVTEARVYRYAGLKCEIQPL